MLNGILSPEQIDYLVQNGVIDVIKSCSINGCKDIAHEAGPYAPVYLAWLGLAATTGVMGISYLINKHKQYQQLPAQEENFEIPADNNSTFAKLANKLNSLNIVNTIFSSVSRSKP